MQERGSTANPVTLITGLDDSNHAGTDKKGEIIVAAFSTLPEDGIVDLQHNRRDMAEAERWLQTPGRDYLFTLLTYDGQSQEGLVLRQQYNLIVAAPLFVRAYLDRHQEIKPTDLKIFLDGVMRGPQRQVIREQLREYRTVVDHFRKKQRTREGKLCKRILCPRVVKVADTLANNFYGTATPEKLLSDPKYASHFVPISIAQMVDGYSLFGIRAQ